MQAHLLLIEILADINRTLPTPSDAGQYIMNGGTKTKNNVDILLRIDPYKGSWGVRLLELEFQNPIEVMFEIMVCIQGNKREDENKETVKDGKVVDFLYSTTIIDRDYAARVLIPLEHFKLLVLDKYFFWDGNQREGRFCG